MRGNFLPDKEFRYLRHFCYSVFDHVNYFDESRRMGQGISAWFPMSPCGSDCIFIVARPKRPVHRRASRTVSEDPS